MFEITSQMTSEDNFIVKIRKKNAVSFLHHYECFFMMQLAKQEQLVKFQPF